MVMGLRKLVAALLVASTLTAVPATAYASEDRDINERVYRGEVVCKGAPGSWCWNHHFVRVENCGGNWSGCFQRDGRYWKLRYPYKGPYNSQAQANCIAGLAFTIASFYYSGPLLLIVGGGAVTAWGCTLQ